MKPPAKKPVKARRMWMVTRENGAWFSIGRTAKECGYSDAYSVYMLKTRDREQVLSQAACAIRDGCARFQSSYEIAEDVLRSLGLLPPLRKAKKP